MSSKALILAAAMLWSLQAAADDRGHDDRCKRGRAKHCKAYIQKMIDPRNDNTAAALERHIDSGWSGAVGIVLVPRSVVGSVTGVGNDPYGLAVALP